MAEPFNAEQFRQQMSGQTPQMQSQMQGQPPIQAQPRPYQPQQAVQRPAHQVAQPMAQPHAPAQYSGQPQTQQIQQSQMPPQAWAPQGQPMQQMHMQHPQAPAHHMPPPYFTSPPSGEVAEAVEEKSKKSRFSLKRKPKAPKVEPDASDMPAEVIASKKPPHTIFIFGMVAGIALFLLGNIAMSALIGNDSAPSLADINRQNAQAEPPVLPKSAENTASVAETVTP